MNRLLIASATRENLEDFCRNTELGLSLQALKGRHGIVPGIAVRNRQGLSALFNYRIEAAEDSDILLFVHDDVYLEDFYILERLQEALEQFDLVGVAGNALPEDDHVNWLHMRSPGEKSLRKADLGNLTGGLATIAPTGRVITLYGPTPKDSILLDSCFLAVRAKTLKERKLCFDTQFEFEFYGEDFCRTCHAAGLRIGTWPISITHASARIMGGPEWETGLTLYRWKWSDKRPCNGLKAVAGSLSISAPNEQEAYSKHTGHEPANAALIIRRMAMGDVVFAEPVVRTVKKLGYRQIFFETHYPEMFQNHPDVEPGFPTCRCDVYALDGVYEMNRAMLVQDAYLSCYDLHLDEGEKVPQLWLSGEERTWAHRLLAEDKWVALDIGYPGGKLWWPPKSWEAVVDLLHGRGFKIVQVGNRVNDLVAMKSIDLNLLGKTDRRQLMAIISECHSMVGIDSGPINIAQAFGTPSVAVYSQQFPPKSFLSEGSSITPLVCDTRLPLDTDAINDLFAMFCYREQTKYGIELSRDAEFAAAVNELVRAYQIEQVIETGTFRGTGSTQVFAKTGLPVHTIECNESHYDVALRNLEKYPNVEVHHGYSLKRAEMLQGLRRERFDGRRMNLHQDVDEYAADFYQREIDHGELPEDLLVKLLNGKRQLVFLDSAGGIGWLEFKAVLAESKSAEVLLMLDDVGHVKHYRSAQRLLQLGYDFRFSHSGRWGWAVLN